MRPILGLKTFLTTLAVAGCYATPAALAQLSGPPSQLVAPPPPPVLPLRQAFHDTARKVLDGVRIVDGKPVGLAIDPLIDGQSGAQTSETQWMNSELRNLVQTQYAHKFQLKPFTRETLATKPLLFIGTLSPPPPIAESGNNGDPYRLWLTVLDFYSQTVLAKGDSRVASTDVTGRPTLAFAEIPLWLKDQATEGYVNTCTAKTKPGDPIHPEYLKRMEEAAVVNEAVVAYESGRFEEALKLYSAAQKTPGGDQLRVHNGVYLSNVKLKRDAEARLAFATLVDYGVRQQKFSVMLTFLPRTTDLASDLVRQAHPMWLRTIGDKVGSTVSCLELVGNASPTGDMKYNDGLSLRRASHVEGLLLSHTTRLGRERVTTRGVGWRNNIIGTGRDDLSDELDRRVEFSLVSCGR